MYIVYRQCFINFFCVIYIQIIRFQLNFYYIEDLYDIANHILNIIVYAYDMHMILQIQFYLKLNFE